jgi:hypothetical protein
MLAHGDKKQLTITLAVSVTGEKLPAQIIFAGTTNACLPKEKTPGVHYSYTSNHWQSVDSTKDLLNSVIFPFFKNKREELGLPKNATGLLIWDIWHSHINEEVIKLCEENHVKLVIVTPGFTGDLQVLDICVNSVFKKAYNKEFQIWYALAFHRLNL